MTDAHENQNEHDAHEEPHVFDKRRIDPVTGQVRGVNAEGAAAEDDSAAAAPAGDAAQEAAASPSEPVETSAEPSISDDDLEKLLSGEGADEAPVEDANGAADAEEQASVRSPEAELAEERLNDLLRLQAEYANYRRRTDREREEAKDRNTADALALFLPILDDFDRAEKAGDLVEGTPLAVIAAKFRGIVERSGLVAYGEKDEAFDHNQHEAIAQVPNPEVTSETVADVVERGYRYGERIVRVAKVAVFTPSA